MNTPKTLFLKKLGLLDTVYEPREDTFLLMDALEQQLLRNVSASAPFCCLEVGCGSGAVTAFVSALLGDRAASLFCTDLNARAVEAARLVWEENGCDARPHSLTAVQGDLAEPLRDRLRGACHAVIFNPPYVVTEALEEELLRYGDAALAWAGGRKGMEVTDRFLAYVAELLAPGGQFFLVALKENDVPDIVSRMQDAGLQGGVVLERRCSNEMLYILRFTS